MKTRKEINQGPSTPQGPAWEKFIKKQEMSKKMKKGDKYKKEIDNKKPRAKNDSERFEENGGQSK